VDRRRKGGERDQAVRAGDGGDDEPVQVVEHGSGEHLAEGPGVAGVRSLQRRQVSRSVALVDDRRGVAESDQHEVEQQPPRSSVAVEERVDLLEAVVGRRHRLHRPCGRAELVETVDPIADRGRHLRPREWCHPPGEGLNFVLAKAARAFAVGGVRVRCHIPGRAESHPVDLSHLGHGQQRSVEPSPRLERLAVDPLGGGGVATHLHVLPQLLIPNRDTVGEEPLDLPEHQRVALDRRGVVDLLVPDGGPDPLGHGRAREAAHVLAKLGERFCQA